MDWLSQKNVAAGVAVQSILAAANLIAQVIALEIEAVIGDVAVPEPHHKPRTLN